MINKYNKMTSVVLASTVILSNVPTYSFANEIIEKTSDNLFTKNINTIQNNTEVNIPDTAFKSCINVALGRSSLSKLPITIADLESITQLNGANKGINSIEGIQYMTNLNYLRLDSNNITDISWLNRLKNIKQLNISDNNIENINALFNLVNLTHLYASNTRILDITPLLNLKKLTNLDISNTLVNNLDKLGEIISLNELYLNNISLSNTAFINKLQNLKSLYLNKSTISEQLLIENMQNLEVISLQESKITSINIKNCPLLLNIYTNQVSGLNNLHLESLPNLKDFSIIHQLNLENISIKNMESLNILNLNGNRLKTINIQDCLSLQHLDASNNNISDLSFLENAKSISSLYFKNNNISDISILSTLKDLTILDLSNQLTTNTMNFGTFNNNSNRVTDISAIKNLEKLRELDLRNNPVLDTTPLKNKHSIINLKLPNQTIYLNDLYTLNESISVDINNIGLFSDYNIDVYDISNNGITDGDNITWNYINEGENNLSFKFKTSLIQEGQKDIDYTGEVFIKTTRDSQAPSIKIEKSTEKWTNKPVTLTITANDNVQVKSIKLPNGTIVYDSNTKYEVAKNGEFTFEVEDIAGNKKTETVKISNIDTTPPSAKISSHSTATKATLTINATDLESGIDKITIISASGVNITGTTNTYDVFENGTYTVNITDKAGNKYVDVIHVTIGETPEDNSNNQNNSNSDNNNGNTNNNNNNSNSNNNNNSNSNNNNNNSNNNNNNNNGNNSNGGSNVNNDVNSNNSGTNGDSTEKPQTGDNILFHIINCLTSVMLLIVINLKKNSR